jgi:hypothetical protein
MANNLPFTIVVRGARAGHGVTSVAAVVGLDGSAQIGSRRAVHDLGTTAALLDFPAASPTAGGDEAEAEAATHESCSRSQASKRPRDAATNRAGVVVVDCGIDALLGPHSGPERRAAGAPGSVLHRAAYCRCQRAMGRRDRAGRRDGAEPVGTRRARRHRRPPGRHRADQPSVAAPSMPHHRRPARPPARPPLSRSRCRRLVTPYLTPALSPEPPATPLERRNHVSGDGTDLPVAPSATRPTLTRHRLPGVETGSSGPVARVGSGRIDGLSSAPGCLPASRRQSSCVASRPSCSWMQIGLRSGARRRIMERLAAVAAGSAPGELSGR